MPEAGKAVEDEEGDADDRPTAQGVVAQKTISEVPPSIQKQTAQFHWLGVNYDIKVKGGGRRLLDDVDGWVKPGTLTALSKSYCRKPLPRVYSDRNSYLPSSRYYYGTT